MKAIAFYRKETGSFVNIPTMEKPGCYYTKDKTDHCPECAKYRQHLASLPEYKADWITPDLDGKKVEVELQFEVYLGGSSGWAITTKEGYDDANEGRRIIALPKQPAWKVGDRFTTPETGDQIFTVSEVTEHDVEAWDMRSAAGYTIFSKSYIKKVESDSKQPVQEEGFYAVEYAGHWNIQRTPYYSADNILDAELVGAKKAKKYAELIAELLNKHYGIIG